MAWHRMCLCMIRFILLLTCTSICESTITDAVAVYHNAWRNKSHEILNEMIWLQQPTTSSSTSVVEEHRRNLLAYSKLGKLSTLSFIHISRTGGGSFNKILAENRGIIGRDGNRHADCIVPKTAYGNSTLPLTSRFDFPHCEILSSIFPMPTVQVCRILLLIEKKKKKDNED
jgi:hypothetical protein